MKIQTNSFEETQKQGEEFAQKLHGGDVVLLFGDLGAGKTTFMQGLAEGLGIERRIISPTFIIVRRYDVPGSDPGQARMTIHTLYHIDLYRTQTEDDLKGLGIPEILEDTSSVVAVEWPEKLGQLIPKKRWGITFTTLDENTRSIEIEKT